MAASVCLFCLEKVCEKICFKKYYLVEQSLCELEAKETEVVKMGFIPTVVETTNILGGSLLSLRLIGCF